MPAAIVILNGYPAVGKHTVARELSKTLNCKVVDCHSLDTVADTFFPKDSLAHQELRKSLRTAMISSLLSPLSRSPPNGPMPSPSPPTIYIFTDTILHASLPVLNSYLPTIDPHPPIVHVVLSCSTSTNISRLSDPTRASRGILTDEGLLVEMRMEEEVARFQTSKGEKVGGLAGEYEIVTDHMDGRTVAGVVGEYVMDALRGAGVWAMLGRRGSAGGRF